MCWGLSNLRRHLDLTALQAMSSHICHYPPYHPASVDPLSSLFPKTMWQTGDLSTSPVAAGIDARSLTGVTIIRCFKNLVLYHIKTSLSPMMIHIRLFPQTHRCCCHCNSHNAKQPELWGCGWVQHHMKTWVYSDEIKKKGCGSHCITPQWTPQKQ